MKESTVFLHDSLRHANTEGSFSGTDHVEISHFSTGVQAEASLLVRAAVRSSRTRWFCFLRRVFHYQNGSRSNLGSNPFNSNTWMAVEFLTLATQIGITGFTLTVSRGEDPVWPMRVWLIGYDMACILSLLLLYCRYWHIQEGGRAVSSTHADLENRMPFHEELLRTSSCSVNRCGTFVELFFAVWFVMGNVWVFDSRLGSFYRAPKLHVLCISLLTWNAIIYSFPFLLFLLLCCIVPLISKLLGYNMNVGSEDRGAFEDEISRIPSLLYKKKMVGRDDGSPVCSICLTKYMEKEEVRKLCCSHTFHLTCIDKWLKTSALCPLCKRDIRR